MKEADRFWLCLLALMNADLEAREAGNTGSACRRVRNDLRRRLVRKGFARESPRGPLLAEDPVRLRRELQIGSTAESLGLLVDLCAVEPWAEVKGRPKLDVHAREMLLSGLSIDLPGETDEDDPEYIDGFLRDGRKLLEPTKAQMIGVALVGVLAAGPVGLAAETVLAATVLSAGVGAAVAGGGHLALVVRRSTPEAAFVNAIKRYALTQALRGYPGLAVEAQEQEAGVLEAANALWKEARTAIDRKPRKALERGARALDRVFKELAPEAWELEETRRMSERAKDFGILVD